MDGDSDKLLYLADNALKGLETLSGMLNKSKTTLTQTDTIQISLSDSDKAGLLGEAKPIQEGKEEAVIEEAEVVA